MKLSDAKPQEIDLPEGTRGFCAQTWQLAELTRDLLGEHETERRPFSIGDILFVAPDAQGRYLEMVEGKLIARGEIVGVFHSA